MKKYGWLIIAAIVLVAGGWWFTIKKTSLPADSGSRLKVAVSLPLLQNIVERIGGDEVAVSSIIKGSTCNHEYEPTAGDMKQAAGCDLFVKAGLGFDPWVDKLMESAASPQTVILDAAQGVTAIHDDEDEHEADKGAPEEEGSDGHDHELGNPHYWGSPANVKLVAKNILDKLITLRSAKQEYFTRNYQQFLAELDQTVAELKTRVERLKDRRIVSYSAAFPYFFEYFGFENQGTVEEAHEQEVSPKRMAEIVRLMKQRQVKVLIGEAVYPRLPENLAQETGARLVLLWSATDESGDYLKTLQVNIEKMVSALQ
jgi:ABC-type Zn uptake system ZnuABC Zn-binding protein ZnuA